VGKGHWWSFFWGKTHIISGFVGKTCLATKNPHRGGIIYWDGFYSPVRNKPGSGTFLLNHCSINGVRFLFSFFLRFFCIPRFPFGCGHWRCGEGLIWGHAVMVLMTTKGGEATTHRFLVCFLKVKGKLFPLTPWNALPPTSLPTPRACVCWNFHRFSIFLGVSGGHPNIRAPPPWHLWLAFLLRCGP